MTINKVSEILDKMNGVLCASYPDGPKIIFKRCACNKKKDCKSFEFILLSKDGEIDTKFWVHDQSEFKFFLSTWSSCFDFPLMDFLVQQFRRVENVLVESEN